MNYITDTKTREKLSAFITAYFSDSEFIGIDSNEDVLNCLDEINGERHKFGEDFLLDTDHWGNVADWADGEVVVTYYSKALRRSIIIDSMFSTDFTKVEDFIERLLIENDEALKQEMVLSAALKERT